MLTYRAWKVVIALRECENCKTENHENANFCKKCGNPLTESAKQHFPEMIKRGGNKHENR